MFVNHPESVASSLSREYIHTILDKMKKLKASSALDRHRAIKVAPLVPSSNTQDLDRLLDDSQERLSRQPHTHINDAFKKYKKEGPY